MASARRGLTMSRMAVGLKLAEEGLILALPQVQSNIARACDCMIEREGGTRRCTGDKNAQQPAIEDGATATMAAIPTKGGRRRCGAGQGNNEEEQKDRGARDRCLNAANSRAKEEVQRKLKKDQGRTPASRIGQGERKHWAMAVEDGERRRSTEVSAADASGRRWTLTKYSALEER